MRISWDQDPQRKGFNEGRSDRGSRVLWYDAGGRGNFQAADVGCGWGPAWEGLSEYSCAVPDVCGDQMG